jgi:hypothetical protein
MNGTAVFALFPAIPFLARPTAAWREALATRDYYTLRNWEWYEWLGLIAPMVIVWWLARVCDKQDQSVASNLLRRLNLYAVVMCVITLATTFPRATDFLWPLQPFRYLHTVYVLMILVAGGLLARRHMRITIAIAGSLALTMCYVQVVQFGLGGAHHIDVPGLASDNAYVQAFVWARDHTPKDAYFALDPEYMRYSDNYGFRALAERSQMADVSKDAGVVTVSPQLASEWKREVDALRGWNNFRVDDFVRLRRDFDVEWVVLPALWHKTPRVLDCPFVSDGGFLAVKQATGGIYYAAVCRTPSAPLPPPGASN